MRKYVLAVVLFAICLCLRAEDRIEHVRELLETNRVSLDYSFAVDKVQYSGTIIIQKDCFKASGNGLDIYCDGHIRWTVDPESKEVYLEDAEEPEAYLGYLSDISDLKTSNVKASPVSEDASMFFFDTSALDASWIITDLRQ